MNRLPTTLISLIVSVSLSLGFLGTVVQAQPPFPLPPVGSNSVSTSGTLYCAGFHSNTTPGRFIFRNFDETGSIVIDGIRVYEGDGTVLYDSATSGLPVGVDGRLGPANNVLGSHQTEAFDSLSAFPLPSSSSFIQLILEWHASTTGVISLVGGSLFSTPDGTGGFTRFGGGCTQG